MAVRTSALVIVLHATCRIFEADLSSRLTSWLVEQQREPGGRDMASKKTDKETTGETAHGRKKPARSKPPAPLLPLAKKHKKRIGALAFSSQENILASGGYDATVRLWNIRTGKHLAVQTRKQFQWAITAIAISPDGLGVASLSAGIKGPARDMTEPLLWDLTSRETSELLPGTHKLHHQLSALAFSPDGSQVAVGGSSIILIDASHPEQEPAVFPDSSCNVIVFSPNGKLIVSGHHDGTICLWDVKKTKKVRRFTGHTTWVTQLAFAPGGKSLASASDDGSVRIWDFPSGKNRCELRGNWKTTSYLAFLGNNKELISFHDPDGQGTLRRWSLAAQREISNWKPLTAAAVVAVAVSPDGSRIATGDDYGNIRIWKTEDVLAATNSRASGSAKKGSKRAPKQITLEQMKERHKIEDKELFGL